MHLQLIAACRNYICMWLPHLHSAHLIPWRPAACIPDCWAVSKQLPYYWPSSCVAPGAAASILGFLHHRWAVGLVLLSKLWESELRVWGYCTKCEEIEMLLLSSSLLFQTLSVLLLSTLQTLNEIWCDSIIIYRNTASEVCQICVFDLIILYCRYGCTKS